MIYSIRYYKAMIDKEFFSEYIKNLKKFKELNIEKKLKEIICIIVLKILIF